MVCRANTNPCCGRLNYGGKLMVPMVFGHFSLLFIFMLESVNKLWCEDVFHSADSSAFGHCAHNAQELLHMLSTQGGNS